LAGFGSGSEKWVQIRSRKDPITTFYRKTCVADPDPGSRIRDAVPFGPLDPGSGIGFFRIPDPTITSESLTLIRLGSSKKNLEI